MLRLAWTVIIVGVVAIEVAWVVGLRRLAVLSLAALAAWPGATVVGGSPLAARWGVVTDAAWIPLLAFATLSTSRSPHRWSWWSVMGLGALTFGLGLVRATHFDPYHDVVCKPCVHGPLFIRADLGLADSMVRFGGVTTVLVGVVVIVSCLAQFSERAELGLGSTWPSLVVGALVALIGGLTLATSPVPQPERLPSSLFDLRVLSLLVLVAIVVWSCYGCIAVRVRLRALTRALSAGDSASAGRLLVDALGDPEASIEYATSSSQVRAGAPQVDRTSPGRRRTEISRRGQVVATIDHSDSISTERLSRLIGPHLRTAIQNEQLQLELEQRLDELNASRRRVVEVSDSTRKQLERDLHDGAQQHVLALLFEVRRGLRDCAQRGAEEDERAWARLHELGVGLLGELRHHAHGLYPATLSHAGLIPALQQLAGREFSEVEVCGDVPTEVAPHLQRTAYALVRDALGGDGGVQRVVVGIDGTSLVLRVEGATPLQPTSIDRVACMHGRYSVGDNGWEVVLPCV